MVLHSNSAHYLSPNLAPTMLKFCTYFVSVTIIASGFKNTFASDEIPDDLARISDGPNESKTQLWQQNTIPKVPTLEATTEDSLRPESHVAEENQLPPRTIKDLLHDKDKPDSPDSDAKLLDGYQIDLDLAGVEVVRRSDPMAAATRREITRARLFAAAKRRERLIDLQIARENRRYLPLRWRGKGRWAKPNKKCKTGYFLEPYWNDHYYFDM